MPKGLHAVISDSDSDEYDARDVTTATLGSRGSAHSDRHVVDATDEEEDDASYMVPKSVDELPNFRLACDEYTGADEDGFSDDLIASHTYYLVEQRFYSQLQNWLQGHSPPPQGPLDNSILFKRKPHIVRADLELDEHYSLVKGAQWNLIMEWFGGGPPIARDAYVEKRTGKVVIDVPGLNVFVKLGDKNNNVHTTVVTRDLKVGSLKRRLCRDYFDKLDPKLIKVEVYEGDKAKVRLTPVSAPLSTFDLRDDDTLVLSLSNEDANDLTSGASSENGWYSSTPPPPPPPINHPPSPTPANRIVQRGEPLVRGAVGLSNLGNTCFMNSTLQCLSNVPPLRAYFESGEFEADINLSNPLGTKGQLARSFADLMCLLWSEDITIVSPFDTKSVIVAKKPVFQGYHQHDSQELLIFILDILHEDVNKVVNKPLTSAVESDGDLDDAHVAAEAKQVFHLRNDSFINDLTESYLKSTVVCPDPNCHRVSVRFDQCTCLTLPVSKASQQNMTVVPVHLRDARRLATPFGEGVASLRLSADSSFLELRYAVASHLDINPESILLSTMYKGEIQQRIRMTNPLEFDVMPLSRMLKGDEVYAFVHPEFAHWRRKRVWAVDSPREFTPARPRNDDCPVWLGEVWIGLWDESRCLVEIVDVSDEAPYMVTARVELDRRATTVSGEIKPDGSLRFSYEDEGFLTGELSNDDWFISKPSKPGEPGRVLLRRYRSAPRDDLMLVYGKPDTRVRFGGSGMAADDARLCESIMLAPRPILGADLWALLSRGVKGELTLSTMSFPSDTLKPTDQVDKESVEFYVAWTGVDGWEERTSQAAANAMENSASGLSIYDCLDLFMLEEQLSPSEAWYCPTCKEHKEAFKKMQLWSLAPVLVIHLKRFSQTESSFFVDKDDSFVDYPLEGLDLNNRVLGPAAGVDYTYDLVGVSHHFGGLGGGHYTATCRNVIDGKWYLFDDSSVTCLGESDDDGFTKSRVCSTSGYVLYYLRRDEWRRATALAAAGAASGSVGVERVEG